MMRRSLIVLLAQGFVAAAVTIDPGPSTLEAQEFAEITVRSGPAPANPFTRFALHGTFRTPAFQTLTVDGFSDSNDGSVHKIRFLATHPGAYSYQLRFDNGREKASYSGAFTVRPSKRKGLLALDPEFPFHFKWSGTGEHYFWNGLTTYALMGWKDDGYIRQIIERAAN